MGAPGRHRGRRAEVGGGTSRGVEGAAGVGVGLGVGVGYWVTGLLGYWV